MLEDWGRGVCWMVRKQKVVVRVWEKERDHDDDVDRK